MASQQGEIWVICNLYYPVIGFIKPIVKDFVITHVDCNDLAAQFAEREEPWVLMDSATAALPVTEDLLSDLGPAEINQVKSWQPSTISQIVYNFWV